MIIGDSLIEKLKYVTNYEIISYPGISLEQYLLNLSSLYDNNIIDIIIYCFGINDINNGITIKKVIGNYNKLKRGSVKTYIILPPFQNHIFLEEIDKLLDDDIFILESFLDNYNTYDGLHPDINTINILKEEILSIFECDSLK